jgi:hypothetical protein
MSALAALDRATETLGTCLTADLGWTLEIEVHATLRAIREARAEILRQAVEAAETFRESPRRDPARRGIDSQD